MERHLSSRTLSRNAPPAPVAVVTEPAVTTRKMLALRLILPLRNALPRFRSAIYLLKGFSFEGIEGMEGLGIEGFSLAKRLVFGPG